MEHAGFFARQLRFRKVMTMNATEISATTIPRFYNEYFDDDDDVDLEISTTEMPWLLWRRSRIC